jgi:hypothetical protein
MKIKPIALFLFISLQIFGQNYPTNFFRMPVDTLVSLSGNFGEIRYDHFHYGWDIRTGGKEGMKIVAAADGYVSRIKTGTYGYGKVIYVTHANGYVTVYAHLSAFNDSIGFYVKNEQYKLQSYETELFPKVGELKVKKGEFIALSGNTGSSEAPHLHFEIRDEKTEEIINPYFFGLDIPDTVKPFFKTLAVYPLLEGVVNGTTNQPTYIELQKKNGKYVFKNKDSVVVTGNFGLGIEVYDLENKTPGQNQIYSLELELNGKIVYTFELKRFAFDQTRYVNCHIDYKAQRKDKKGIQRTHIIDGNKFPGYSTTENNGMLNLSNDSIHRVRFIAKDFYGNTSVFTFYIQSKRNQAAENRMLQEEGGLNKYQINYKDSFALNGDYLKLFVPKNTFYSSFTLEVSKFLSIKQTYSIPFVLRDYYVPLHKYITISLKNTVQVADSLKKKLTIVSVNNNGGFVNEGGEYNDNWVTTKTRSMGLYTIAMDSTAPKIKIPILPKSKNINTLQAIEIKVSDNLTGIKEYSAYIDGEWILMEYEHKKNTFIIINGDLPKGKHTITINAMDGKENKSSISFEYVK